MEWLQNYRIGYLLNKLNDKKGNVRWGAASNLSEIKNFKMTDKLENKLIRTLSIENDSAVRLCLVGALGNLGTPAAIPCLLNFFKSFRWPMSESDSKLRENIHWAICHIAKRSKTHDFLVILFEDIEIVDRIDILFIFEEILQDNSQIILTEQSRKQLLYHIENKLFYYRNLHHRGEKRADGSYYIMGWDEINEEKRYKIIFDQIVGLNKNPK